MPRTRQVDPIDPARARLATAAVAIEFGVPDLTLDHPDLRNPLCDFSRQVAMYLTASLYGMTMTRIGELFSRDRSTVSHAIRVIEDGRTDPVLDEKIDRLETWLGEVNLP
jgi:chromosomal replication initiation ATPase DnaA